jgi:hypothetical protein
MKRARAIFSLPMAPSHSEYQLFVEIEALPEV